MHSRRILLLTAIGFMFVPPLASQTLARPDVFGPTPLAASASLPTELSGNESQSVIPAPPESPVAEYRRALQDFRKQKHQYVHCKLKTGKILTGRIKDA